MLTTDIVVSSSVPRNPESFALMSRPLMTAETCTGMPRAPCQEMKMPQDTASHARTLPPKNGRSLLRRLLMFPLMVAYRAIHAVLVRRK